MNNNKKEVIKGLLRDTLNNYEVGQNETVGTGEFFGFEFFNYGGKVHLYENNSNTRVESKMRELSYEVKSTYGFDNYELKMENADIYNIFLNAEINESNSLSVLLKSYRILRMMLLDNGFFLKSNENISRGIFLIHHLSMSNLSVSFYDEKGIMNKDDILLHKVFNDLIELNLIKWVSDNKEDGFRWADNNTLLLKIIDFLREEIIYLIINKCYSMSKEETFNALSYLNINKKDIDRMFKLIY